jgi:hypothetical protein
MIAAQAAARAAHNEGIARAQAGDATGAVAQLRRAVALAGADAVDPRTLKALWQLAQVADDWGVAVAAGVRAALRDPDDAPFVQNVLRSLARCPEAAFGAGVSPLPLPPALPSLSVVVVSQDDARWAAVDREYACAFAGWPHERIRVKGARSMYDGYARGFAQSSGEWVVFSHDDIRFAVPDFAARLAHALADADMVGVAGTTRLVAPALLGAGHPQLFGTITHEDRERSDLEFSVLSLRGPQVAGAQALDGVFIAARRAWIDRLGFDAAHFGGFHFYDLDFSYRAHLAGARVAIAADLGLIHRSRGPIDARWFDAQRAFAAKFGLPAVTPGTRQHWYTVRLPDAGAVAAMYAKLAAARALAP